MGRVCGEGGIVLAALGLPNVGALQTRPMPELRSRHFYFRISLKRDWLILK